MLEKGKAYLWIFIEPNSWVAYKVIDIYEDEELFKPIGRFPKLNDDNIVIKLELLCAPNEYAEELILPLFTVPQKSSGDGYVYELNLDYDIEPQIVKYLL